MQRDTMTGMLTSVNYIRNTEGKIDWKAMIPKHCLYIKKDKKASIEKRLNKKFEDITVDEALDSELASTMEGMNYLLDARGYSSVDTKIDIASLDFVSATCTISFIPFDGDVAKSFSASACAHFSNTDDWYRNYLVEAASNRARMRAIRLFLGISIVNSEEITEKIKSESTSSSAETLTPDSNSMTNVLRKKIKLHMKNKNIPLSIIKTKANLDASVTSVDQIPEDKLFEVADRCEKFGGIAG